MSSASPLTPGIYQPTNLGGTIDKFPKPAPRAPYGSALSAFVGLPVSDLWLLYIRDDKGQLSGTLDSWQISVKYAY